jgi:hypothetical protein
MTDAGSTKESVFFCPMSDDNRKTETTKVVAVVVVGASQDSFSCSDSPW